MCSFNRYNSHLCERQLEPTIITMFWNLMSNDQPCTAREGSLFVFRELPSESIRTSCKIPHAQRSRVSSLTKKERVQISLVDTENRHSRFWNCLLLGGHSLYWSQCFLVMNHGAHLRKGTKENLIIPTCFCRWFYNFYVSSFSSPSYSGKAYFNPVSAVSTSALGYPQSRHVKESGVWQYLPWSYSSSRFKVCI